MLRALEGMGLHTAGIVDDRGKYIVLRVVGSSGTYVVKVPKNIVDPDAPPTGLSMESECRASRVLASCPNVASSRVVGLEGARAVLREFFPRTLRDEIEEGLDEPRVARYTKCLARALECIHRRGYAVADLKPENVGVRSGEAYVMDLDSATPLYTRPRSYTPSYAAPELLKPPYKILRESDLYQLGLVLREMLDSCSDCGNELDTLCKKLLDTNPFRRGSAREVLNELSRLCIARGY